MSGRSGLNSECFKPLQPTGSLRQFYISTTAGQIFFYRLCLKQVEQDAGCRLLLAWIHFRINEVEK